jgi:NADH-quinone oxidoreductase subunit L
MHHYYPLLIPLLPFLAALLTARPGGRASEGVYRLGLLAHFAAFLLSLPVLREVAAPGHPAISVTLFASAWQGPLTLAFQFDRLAAVMMVVVSGVGTLIYLYAIRYMRQERGRARYHTLLAFAIAALLCMVSSANLLLLVLFWQLLSWLLSLLAYNHEHAPTAGSIFRTFTMLRLGDVAFLAGIVLAYALYGTLDLQPLFAQAAHSQAVVSLWPGGPAMRGATAVTLLIFIGAMSKSAQFPLHMWLPDSLYAPTTTTGLLHAGIINAAGFLLNRLAPLYGLSPATLHLVFLIGTVTTFLGASMMLTQNDIKKTLVYSTIGQMGYMVMECGLGAFALAVFHLVAHGLFKATSFLNSGSGIHSARQEPRLPARDIAEAAAEEEPAEFSLLTWATGFTTTLILPLVIMLAAHGVLSLPFRDSQGVEIFLFFSWVTSSQAILTLYRLKAVASRRVAALMLLTLLVVVSTYLLAAEAFTYFLYPAPGEVAFYFAAAALPAWLFDTIIGATVLLIIVGWILIYARHHGRTLWVPGRFAEVIGRLQVQLYLLLMNRLYLDAVALRFHRRGMGFGRRLNQSRWFPIAWGVLALTALVPAVARAMALPSGQMVMLVVAVVALPLFPFHGLYITALTRPSGPLTAFLPIVFAFLLPAAGLYVAAPLLPRLPAELLHGIRILALYGVVFGSLKALVQFRVRRLLAHAGLVFHSLLWWHLAVAGGYTLQAGIYARAAILVTAGLLLAWYAVQTRYGNLDLDRIGGLAQTMPRFSALFALLVMAAVGLPPFGLFLGFMGIVLDASVRASAWELAIVFGAWFAASWYLFRLLKRLLFGPPRADIPYEDLRANEAAAAVVVLAALLVVGAGGIGEVGSVRVGDPVNDPQLVTWSQAAP